MHDGWSMEQGGGQAGQGALCGRLPRSEAGHAVATGGLQYGQPVAHTDGHAPGGSGSSKGEQADMGGVRAAGGGHRWSQGPADAGTGVACVGEPEGVNPEAVCPQEPAGVAAGTPVTTRGVLSLIHQQDYRCALTARPLTPDTAALDHIVPVQWEHIIENTQVLHKDVNRAKGTMTNEEFVCLCEEVVETRRLRKANR